MYIQNGLLEMGWMANGYKTIQLKIKYFKYVICVSGLP